jgi:hypothetical protein
MNQERGRQALLTVLGVSAGVAAGLWLWQRRESPRQAASRWTPSTGAGADVAAALRRDRTLSRRSIEVDSIADGVIELTGTVESRDEARRAVAIAQSARGVYTVVNRLAVETEEARREENRRRRENGAPELQERHHYGMGVGMGTRRQSSETDPDRPSDKQKILDRELDAPNVAEAEADALAEEPEVDAPSADADVAPGESVSTEDEEART